MNNYNIQWAIDCDSEQLKVSGHNLYKVLGIQKPYTNWFLSVCEYGFEERKDFEIILDETDNGCQILDHQLSIEMAKEICMLCRTEIGKECRKYLASIEHQWNSPETVFARALKIAKQRIEKLEQRVLHLNELIAKKNQEIVKLQLKNTYYDVIFSNEDLLTISQISKDYGWPVRKMNRILELMGVQEKQNKNWIVHQKYVKEGCVVKKLSGYKDENGKEHTKVYTYWTQTGRLFLYHLLKKNGDLPLIEKG